MIQRTSAILAAALLSGCIFGGGGDDPEPNNEFADDTGNTSGTVDAGPDATPADETYLPATVRAISCDEPAALRFAPDSTGLPSLNDQSIVGTQAPPFEGVLRSPIGELSLVYVSPSSSGVEVFVGAMDTTGLAMVPRQGFYGSAKIEASAVLGMFIQNFQYTEGNGQPVIVATISTDAGVFDCGLAAGDEPQLECRPSNIAEATGLATLSRVQFVPNLEWDDAADHYWFGLLRPELLVAASGTDDSGAAALNLFQGGANPDEVDDSAVSEIGPQGFFAERAMFGVDEISRGCAIVAALDAEGQPAVYAPVDRGCTTFERQDRGAWTVSSRISLTDDKKFTFVDGYSTRAGYKDLVRVFVEEGTINLGYVAVADDEIVLSRPGGFAAGSVDFLEMPFEGAREVAAFKNLPFQKQDGDPGSGQPLVSVIHGASADKLAMFAWDVGQGDVYLIENALPAGVSNARGIAAQWFYGDQGNISLVGQSNGSWEAVVVVVPDVANLGAGCL